MVFRLPKELTLYTFESAKMQHIKCYMINVEIRRALQIADDEKLCYFMEWINNEVRFVL